MAQQNILLKQGFTQVVVQVCYNYIKLCRTFFNIGKLFYGKLLNSIHFSLFSFVTGRIVHIVSRWNGRRMLAMGPDRPSGSRTVFHPRNGQCLANHFRKENRSFCRRSSIDQSIGRIRRLQPHVQTNFSGSAHNLATINCRNGRYGQILQSWQGRNVLSAAA